MTMRLAFVLLCLLAGSAGAIVVDRVNDTTGLDTEVTTNTVTMRHGDWFRYRVQATQGTNVLPYTGATSIQGTLVDARLGDVVARATGTVNSADAATFTLYLLPGTILDTGAWYRLKSWVYAGTNLLGTVIHDPVNMLGAEATSGGGGGSVAITVTAATPASVTVNQPSGVTSLNGLTGPVTVAAGGLGLRVTTNASGSVTVTNDLPIPSASGGYPLTLQFIPTNGTYNWQPIGTLDSIPSSSVGTNLAPFDYIGRTWQQWTVPVGITQVEFYVWGGGGAGAGSPASGASAGFVYMFATVVPGTIFDLAVAEGGEGAVPTTRTVVTNAWVGGGVRTTNVCASYNGGGASIVKLGGTTNYYCVAAGGSAGCGSGGNYGMGGGKNGGARYVALSETNAVVGTHATADNYYGLNAAGGTNGYDAAANGGFLQAGPSIWLAPSTSALGVFCAGSGWRGGAGAVVISTNGVSGHPAMGCGGGNSFINPLFGSGYTERGGPTYAYVGGSEYPWHGGTAGTGGQNGSGRNGRIVVRY